jgi:AcrR family transcriptional regulator
MVRIVKKPEVRRREIVSASRELFLKKGYEKTTMQDVMNKLNIAKGTTYHYFKSKEELLESVVQDIVQEYLTAVEKVLNATQGSALEKIRSLVAAGRVADKQREFMDKLHHPSNIAMHTRLLAVTISGLAPLYARVIQQGCDEGIFKTEHPLESAELLLAGIQFLTDVGCYPWSQEELIRRERAIPALLETQLKAPKDSFNFLLQA